MSGANFGTAGPQELADMPLTGLDRAVAGAGQGIAQQVMTPGALMKPNPYESERGSERWQWYEDAKNRAELNWAPEMALNMMGTGGIMGVPVKGAEKALGSGIVRPFMKQPNELYHVVGPEYEAGQPLRSLYSRKGNAAYDEYAARWPEAGDLVQYHPHQNFFYDKLADAENHAADFGGKVLKIDPQKVEGLNFDKNEGFWTTREDVSPDAFLNK